jgi:transcription initiation factor TFIIIB Brf1 subunit/transcription initiation factor TFIIB
MDSRDIFDILQNDNYDDSEIFKHLDKLDDLLYISNIENQIDEDIQQNINECIHTNTILDSIEGITVCRDCGQVLDNIVDRNAEWRSYDDDFGNKFDSERCSAITNPLLPQSSLGTTFVRKNKGRYMTQMERLHSWNTMPYRERSLNIVFKIINDKCIKGNIFNCIADDAKIMYKKLSNIKHDNGKNKGKFIIIRGDNRKSLIAASVWCGCRRKKKTRSQKEIAVLFTLKDKAMSMGCKNFQKYMKIIDPNFDVGTSSPEHFVERHCDELKIKNNAKERAIQIAKNITRLNIASTHTPYSISMGCILIISEIFNYYEYTKKTLSKIFDVSEVTINKTYKKIEPFKNILLNDNTVLEYENNINSNNIATPLYVIKRKVQIMNMQCKYSLYKLNSQNIQLDIHLNQSIIQCNNLFFKLSHRFKLDSN